MDLPRIKEIMFHVCHCLVLLEYRPLMRGENFKARLLVNKMIPFRWRSHSGEEAAASMTSPDFPDSNLSSLAPPTTGVTAHTMWTGCLFLVKRTSVLGGARESVIRCGRERRRNAPLPAGDVASSTAPRDEPRGPTGIAPSRHFRFELDLWMFLCG